MYPQRQCRPGRAQTRLRAWCQHSKLERGCKKGDHQRWLFFDIKDRCKTPPNEVIVLSTVLQTKWRGANAPGTRARTSGFTAVRMRAVQSAILIRHMREDLSGPNCCAAIPPALTRRSWRVTTLKMASCGRYVVDSPVSEHHHWYHIFPADPLFRRPLIAFTISGRS